MQNLNDLIGELVDVFDKLKNDQISIDKANAMCTAAGKIVSVVNTQIQIVLIGGTETTPFMKGETQPLRKLTVVSKKEAVEGLKKKLTNRG